jgi:alpha(1,3/1,4) fucosyltransferase
MQKIFIQPPNEIFSNNGLFNRIDVGHDLFCWQELKRKFFELGYELITADDNSLDDCAWILFIDSASLDGLGLREIGIKSWVKKKLKRGKTNFWSTRPLYEEAKKKGFKNMTLLLWEGKSVNIVNYNPRVWDKFEHLLTWDDDLVDNQKFFKLYLPIPNTRAIEFVTSFSQKKLLVNVTINKYSSYKNELYSQRRKSINYFYKNYPQDFDLYGYRWNQPATKWQRAFPWLVKKYINYLGQTDNKLKTLSHYKFILCYENISDAKGWVTEKIFDAFKGRTVPIYLGAPNIEEYVDKDAFIDRRKFKNDKELADFIIKMPEYEYNKYLEAADRYMQSEKYAKFSAQNFCDRIIEILNLENE